jgi:hypothetical protein
MAPEERTGRANREMATAVPYYLDCANTSRKPGKMERNRCWQVTAVGLVIGAAACAGNARTPLAIDTPLVTADTPQLGLRQLALARLQAKMQQRGSNLPPNLEVLSDLGTTAPPNPCAVNDHMPVVKDSTATVPIPNGAAAGFKNAVRMPNPCIVEETRK